MAWYFSFYDCSLFRLHIYGVCIFIYWTFVFCITYRAQAECSDHWVRCFLNEKHTFSSKCRWMSMRNISNECDWIKHVNPFGCRLAHSQRNDKRAERMGESKRTCIKTFTAVAFWVIEISWMRCAVVGCRCPWLETTGWMMWSDRFVHYMETSQVLLSHALQIRTHTHTDTHIRQSLQKQQHWCAYLTVIYVQMHSGHLEKLLWRHIWCQVVDKIHIHTEWY